MPTVKTLGYSKTASLSTIDLDALAAGIGVSAPAAYNALMNAYNVKDTTFGAVGDGSHDDTAAIRAALAAAAVNGGQVLVPPGTYKITGQLLIPSKVRLKGYGAASVVNCSGFIAASGAGDTTPYAVYGAAVSDASIEDLTFTGGNAFAIFFSGGARVAVRRVEVTGAGTVLGPNNYAGGIGFAGTNDITCEDNYCHGNGIGGDSPRYFDIQLNGPGQFSHRVKICGNRCESTTVHFNIGMFDADYVLVEDNHCTGALNNSGNNSGYGILMYRSLAYGIGTTMVVVFMNNAVHDTQGTAYYLKEVYYFRCHHNYAADVATTQDDATLAVGGVVVNNSLEGIVDANVILRSGKAGISIAVDTTTRIIVALNDIDTTGRFALELRGAMEAIAVQTNVVKDGHGGIGYSAAPLTLVAGALEGNIIKGGLGTNAAILLDGVLRIRASGGQIISPPNIGVQFIGCNDCSLKDITIYGTGAEAVKDSGGSDNEYEGVRAIDGGTLAAATYVAMNLQSPNTIARRCRIKNTLGPTNGYSVGIVIASTATASVVEGNWAKGATSLTDISIDPAAGAILGPNIITTSGALYMLPQYTGLGYDSTAGIQLDIGTRTGNRVRNSFGARISGGEPVWGANASQTQTAGAFVDNWHQNASGSASWLVRLELGGGFEVFYAAAGTADGPFATFWTATPPFRVDLNGKVYINGLKMLDSRSTGWTNQTAVASKADLGAAPTVAQLASWASAVDVMLKTQGMIST